MSGDSFDSPDGRTYSSMADLAADIASGMYDGEPASDDPDVTEFAGADMGQAFEAGMRAAIAAREPYVEAASETHSEWSRRVGAHCPVCGQPVAGTCTSCAALPCRADTTDPVAPDPPCAGYRRQTAAGPVMTPAVVRPVFGSTLILAVPPGAGEADVQRLRDHLAANAPEDCVTVVAVRGVEALRTWEPQAAPGMATLAAAWDARAAEPDRDRISAASWRIAARELRELAGGAR